ncbi:MAG: hypothetical protein QXE96_03080 [Candidatus Caldarchaeum sp.]
MNIGKMLGYLLMFLAVGGAILYALWLLGAIPFLDPEAAVKTTALLVMLFLFLVIGFIGYVAATTKPPKPIKR